MSTSGTAAYAERADLSALVRAAVDLANERRFGNSCRPEQGELLRILARGVGAGAIGETGTGCGVGLAWLASGAHPGARLVSVERDPGRAAAARELFRGNASVEVRTGDWPAILDRAPFDLLVLDGGGQGKGAEPPLDPAGWLRPGGLVVIDDFTPSTDWPPMFDGWVDTTRQYWLAHPALHATEVNVTPDSATILARYIG
jgi:predicted O-methyltransferase YrrM